LDGCNMTTPSPIRNNNLLLVLYDMRLLIWSWSKPS
jgi:hypothetical protein